MSNMRVSQAAFAVEKFDNNDSQVLLFIKDNPGTNRATVASSLGINLEILDLVIEILVQDLYVILAYDIDGFELLYEASNWISNLQSKHNDARNWVKQNQTAHVSDLAAGIGVSFEVASALAWRLQYEGTAKLSGE